MLRGRSYAPARLLARATLTATLLCGIALAQAPVASAEEVVNVTLNIPADPRPNPCAAGDLVSLSGTLHIVYYVRSDGQGGYHLNQLLSEKLSGQAFMSGDTYQGSDSYDHSFYARAPFPTADTMVHSLLLVSRSGTDNLVMGYTIHTTVSAQGVPTAQVTDIRLQCTG
jgi:hypothetical protein